MGIGQILSIVSFVAGIVVYFRVPHLEAWPFFVATFVLWMIAPTKRS